MISNFHYLKKSNRIVSVDVLRGFTIFLMILVNSPGSWKYVYEPLKHSDWHGCTLADIVFPGFIFIIGLSISLSYPQGKKLSFKKIFKRTILIFCIGVLINWFPFFETNINELRLFGILQRIALSYFLAVCVISFTTGPKQILLLTFILLIAHWSILYFFGDSNPFSLTGNISKTIDVFLVSKKHVYSGYGIAFDPEGVLGTLSSASQVLIGYLTGINLYNKDSLEVSSLLKFIIFSLFLIFLGYQLNPIYPINKPLWTGSYVLYSSGIYMMLLMIVTWIVDYKKKKSWSFIFIVFGYNPLISFILSILILKTFIKIINISGQPFSYWIYQNIFQKNFSEHFGSFIYSIFFTFLIWGLSYILYKRKIIFKI